MHFNVPRMRAVLSSLAPPVRCLEVATCRGREFNAEELAQALFGLHSQEDSPERRAMIGALTPKVRGVLGPEQGRCTLRVEVERSSSGTSFPLHTLPASPLGIQSFLLHGNSRTRVAFACHALQGCSACCSL